MDLILAALAPIIIILFYVYYRDKYEKEPIYLLFLSLIVGASITAPIMVVEYLTGYFIPFFPGIFSPMYDAFFVASLTEEGFKFLAVILLVWRNKNFNQRFDGILYAVFVSLGFAAVENIMYVVQHNQGMMVALSRAFTAVPAHAIFGVTMGYQLALARFCPVQQSSYLRKALLLPILFHGIYDFILMSKHPIFLALFFPFMIYLMLRARNRINQEVMSPGDCPHKHANDKVKQSNLNNSANATLLLEEMYSQEEMNTFIKEGNYIVDLEIQETNDLSNIENICLSNLEEQQNNSEE